MILEDYNARGERYIISKNKDSAIPLEKCEEIPCLFQTMK
jgi:hypothetical protein